MEDKELLKTISKRVANIVKHDRGTTITFEDGTKLELDGAPVSIDVNVPTCSFCGSPADDDPLFTIDGKVFICKDCVALAFDTLLKNGVSLPINAKVASIIGEQP